MNEALEIIDKQIRVLNEISRTRALMLEEVRSLEILVKSRVLLTANPAKSDTEAKSPLADIDSETLKKIILLELVDTQSEN